MAYLNHGRDTVVAFMRNAFVAIFTLLLVSAGPATQPAINWQPYSDQVFAQAKKQHKLVILDLHAVWCHWCHVQDKETYENPKIQKLIDDNFLAIGVDQDSRPDISNRYEDYGWPATIIFDSDGKEIVKRRGFIPAEQMELLLKACIADPTPGPSVQPAVEIHAAGQAALSAASVAKLNKDLVDYYDDTQGGWGRGFKFVDANLIEYCTLLAMHGDKQAEHMARQTLIAATKIIDPAWGGVYQYSTDGDWVHPHFEKIISYQTDDMRTYARSYAVWHDPQYLSNAQAIHHFLENFLLSPHGAFYTSQDADLIDGQHSDKYFALSDADRRKLGIPRIDTHIYSRENGWAISSLVALHEYTGDPKALDEAIKAAYWILGNRRIDGGGFRHDDKDVAGPYLGDTLAMGRAFLDLYQATADGDWLDRAHAAADFIEKNFVPKDSSSAGVLTAMVKPGDSIRIDPEVEENIAVVRFARLLFAYTGIGDHEKLAERAMKYLAAPEVVNTRGWMVGGLLLANGEMNADPPHITVVGSKSDPAAKNLYAQIADWPVIYKRIEWYDPDELQRMLMRMDVEYPRLKNSAAFVCAGGACSTPITDISKLQKKLQGLTGK
jgi:uncharacterized protein YyaL (SSP411 family)